MVDAGETTPKWFGPRDTTMVCQAILNGWDIPEAERPEILAYLQSVLNSGQCRPRRHDRVQAAITKLESVIKATPIVAPGTE